MRNYLRWTATLATLLALTACANHEEALERAEGFYVGGRASETQTPDAYVLFDPQCSYCAAQWRNFQPLQSQILVKWIPVGVLGDASVDLAAALLMSSDPESSMGEHLVALAADGATLSDTQEVSDEARALVRQNNVVLDNLGTKSVPTIVYRDRATGKILITSGVATTAELARALGGENMPTPGWIGRGEP